MNSPAPQNQRAQWMSLMATAPSATLATCVAAYGTLPEYSWLRRPEIGLAMVRARTGGTGGQFNLGEMSVTRCALRLGSGEMGVAYVAGRDLQHAQWAAMFDALMQSDAAPQVREKVLVPLAAAVAEKQARTDAQAQATRVEFMTMVRGEAA